MTTKTLIKEGKLIEAGYDYRTDDGKLIERVYIGRGTGWKVNGQVYRDLWTAYQNRNSQED